MSPIQNFLDHLGRFHPLSKPLIEYLSETVREEVHLKNHILLEQEHISDHMWFIHQGSARVFRQKSESTDELTIWFFNANELILPFNGVGARLKSEFCIITAQKCVLLSLSQAHLKYLNVLFPEFHLISKGFLESMIEALTMHLDRVQHGSSNERYLQVMQTNPSLFHQASLKDIASYLGMSITTLKHIRYQQK